MFGFKEAKQKAHDWAHDTKGTYERTLEVINEILEPTTELVGIWENDYSYIMSKKDIADAKSNFYRFDFKLLEYYTSTVFNKELNVLISNGDSKYEASRKLLLERYRSLGYTDENEFNEFWRLIMELDKAIFTSENIKRDLIKKNYNLAFFKSRLINLVRQKNGVYASIIGNYEDVIKILGENGVLLEAGDIKALSYIESMEEFKEYLENKKSVLELDLAEPKRF